MKAEGIHSTAAAPAGERLLLALELALPWLGVEPLCALASTSSAVAELVKRAEHVWRALGVAQRGEDFWRRAAERHAASSRPLGSWRAEVLRLHRFERLCDRKLGHQLSNVTLYLMWSAMDVAQQGPDNVAISQHIRPPECPLPTKTAAASSSRNPLRAGF